MGPISRYSTFNFALAYINTREDSITGKTIYFTPDGEDEVIRDAISQKIDRSLANSSSKFWRESTKTKTTTSPFQIGDSLRYTN